MNRSLEYRAVVMSLLAASTSLGGAGLAAWAMQTGWIPLAAESASSAAIMEPSPQLINQGSRFYAMSCSHCHADDATGDEGPTLHNLTISDARIATTIRKGVKGEMPAFNRKYDDQQIVALVSYLRSLH